MDYEVYYTIHQCYNYWVNTVMSIRRLIYQSIIDITCTCVVNVDVYDKSKVSLYAPLF